MILSQQEITRVLVRWSGGDKKALEDLLPLVYDELRRVAGGLLKRERQDHTLQPTALVHEVYMRLLKERGMKWENRNHFFAVAAQLMRYILVNHARDRNRQRRGGKELQRVSLDEALEVYQSTDLDLVALDEALERLGRLDDRQGRIVELRFFGGMSVEETADVLGISTSTVKREWSMARAWLHSRLQQSPASSVDQPG